jgi:sulfate adenylyltransferase large subunit
MDLQWLRIVVVGHVDHGKSTLIGRLLHDAGALPDSRLDELRADSPADGLEWAFLLDHLREEREQERTIDSTQAFFATPRRVYRIIDAPGHREFLKNMVTGAAQADAAILVVDVEAGVLEQTRRHAAMLAMLGQRRIIVAINKMDRIEGRPDAFGAIAADTLSLLAQTTLTAHAVIPISARHGWNLAACAAPLEWYDGPTLFEALDSLAPPEPLSNLPLRLPVQDVYVLNGRNVIVGRIESGRLAQKQEVLLLPSAQTVRIASIERFLENRTAAEAGESIGLTLDGPVAVRRGDVLCDPDSPPPIARRFEANLFWLADEGWQQGDSLLLRCATQASECQIEAVRRRIDSATLDVIETEAKRLEATEVGHVVLSLERPITVEEFASGSSLGRFVLLKNQKVCAGGTVAGHFRF